MYMYYPSEEPWVLEMREWIIRNPIYDEDNVSRQAQEARMLEIQKVRIRSFIANALPPKPHPSHIVPSLGNINRRINKLLDANTKENGYPHGDEIRELRKIKKQIIK